MSAPLRFDLAYGKRGAREGRDANGKKEYIVDEERKAKLADIPPYFNPMSGDYPTIAKEANRLNEQQMRGKFLDYLFWPEIVPAEPAAA